MLVDRSSADDRQYGLQELSALVMSWLASLPAPTLNPPDTRGLSGAWRSPAEWAVLAGEAGLAAAPVVFDSAAEPAGGIGWYAMGPYGPFVEDVIVVGEAVFSGADLPPSAVDACRRLAASSSTPMLGDRVRRRWDGAGLGVTPLPDLRAGGDAAIEAVAEALGRGTGRAMILVCGIPTEPPIARVLHELERLGAPTVVFNQRQFESCRLAWAVADRRVSGWLGVDGRAYDLESFTGVYARLMDDRLLPELDGEPDESPRRRRCRPAPRPARGLDGRRPRSGRQPGPHDGLERVQAVPGAADPPPRLPGPRDPGHQRRRAGPRSSAPATAGSCTSRSAASGRSSPR